MDVLAEDVEAGDDAVEAEVLQEAWEVFRAGTDGVRQERLADGGKMPLRPTSSTEAFDWQ
jgi:hypothetical protein